MQDVLAGHARDEVEGPAHGDGHRLRRDQALACLAVRFRDALPLRFGPGEHAGERGHGGGIASGGWTPLGAGDRGALPGDVLAEGGQTQVDDGELGRLMQEELDNRDKQEVA